ncbi:MAG TPA: TRAP transporter substrate-binding protein [Ramlibacter sp.]|jgi:TRAP-type C4-dicarboxylate transport system substrate-binding protein|nr:TRAP transporter substrate-binding protein [Ramlibacter sp.]
MRFLSRLIRSVAAASLLAAAAAPVVAADFTMKIGFGTMNDIQHQWGTWMKEALEARSKGRIEVKLFPRNQLGTIASQIEGVQMGTIEAFTSPADFFVGVDPRFGVFSIPVLFKDMEHAEKTLLDPALNKEILNLGADKGLQVLSVYTFAYANYFGKQPLRTLADFKGKKLRVNATPAERAKMRQLGATAVPMDLAEVVPGLQQGVIDGTQSATAVYVNLKFNEINKVLTDSNDTMVVSVAAVSRAFLNKLPPDLRQMVIEEGAKLQPKMMAQSRTIDTAMRAKWSEVGGEWAKFSADDQARMRQLLGGIGDEVTKDNPQVNGFYKRVLETSRKY